MKRLALVGIGLAACVQLGCAWLGPRSIRSSRAAYNDAIVATDSEQMLDTIVRMRYGEPSSMLAVSSITANMHVSATGGAEFGVGSASNYAGNLTPLSAGGSYEENPTISYTPLQGEKYLRQLLSPIPLDVTLLLLDAVDTAPEFAALLLRSISGVPSPGLEPDPSVPPDPRFGRIAEAIATLARGRSAEWVVPQPGAAPSYALVLEGEGDDYVQQVVELHRLLGLKPPRQIGRVTRIPIANDASADAIVFRTRSLYELFDIAAAAVEVPSEHVASGIAPRGPAPPERGIHIHSSESAPDHAMTAIERHGYWYWIDASDTESKLIFRVLSSLMSVQLADEGDRARPILTLPVSR